MTVKIKSYNRIAEEKTSAPYQKLEFLQRNQCLIVVLHVYNSTGGLSSTSQRSSSWFQLCSDSKETWRWLWPPGCPQRWDAILCFVKQTLHPLPVCLKCLSLVDRPDVSLGSGGRVSHPFSSFIQPPAEFILWLLFLLKLSHHTGAEKGDSNTWGLHNSTKMHPGKSHHMRLQQKHHRPAEACAARPLWALWVFKSFDPRSNNIIQITEKLVSKNRLCALAV